MIWQIIQKFLEKLTSENLSKGILILILIISAGTFGYAFFESTTITNGLWWSIVTMTTVGYGDLFPTTLGGRILAVVIMTTGIGILGAITAAFASALMEKRLKEIRGMKAIKIKDHFLICGWNFRGKEIIEEMKADKKCSGSDIIIIADLTESPCEGKKGVYFVRGDINKEALEKANVSKAKCAVVLLDESLDIFSRDAKSILSSLTIKKLNPAVYVSVELADSANLEQCKIAGADEIIVAGELTTNLLVQSVLDHGITRCISELVTNRSGHEFYKIKTPKELTGQNFSDVLLHFKKTKNILVIGIEKEIDSKMITNPPADLIINETDNLIVIAEERPF